MQKLISQLCEWPEGAIEWVWDELQKCEEWCAVQIGDSEPAQPWLIFLQSTQWLQCTAPAVQRASLFSLLHTSATTSYWLVYFNSARNHHGEGFTLEAFPLIQQQKRREINIYNLWHICGQKHVHYHGTGWQPLQTTQVLLSLTSFPPKQQQTHSDVITANVSVNQVLRVSLSTGWKLIRQIGWSRVKEDFVMFVTRILKISAQASRNRSLTAKGVYSGAERQNSLSLNEHDSSPALIRRRQSSADCTNAEPLAANDRHHYLFKASSVSASTFANRKWCVTLRRSAHELICLLVEHGKTVANYLAALSGG